jgi:hypothetical protein
MKIVAAVNPVPSYSARYDSPAVRYWAFKISLAVLIYRSERYTSS